jgi:hypothetical protein
LGAAVKSKKLPLGVHVTIRLEPDMANRLREVARRHGCGYTSMIREWVEERLLRETSPLVPQPPDIHVAGEGGTEPVQVTGAGRLRSQAAP